MSCPSSFYNKHITIDGGFSDDLFFKDNTVNNWYFEQYLDWKKYNIFYGKYKAAKDYSNDYQDALYNLLQTKSLHPDIKGFIKCLINKYKNLSKKQLLTLLDDCKQNKESNQITINSRNIIMGNNYKINLQQPQQQNTPPQQNQPEEEPILLSPIPPQKKRDYTEMADDDNNNFDNDNINFDNEEDICNDSSWHSADCHKRRKYEYNYLTGDIQLSCNVSEDWIINDINVSDLLMKYRIKSILGANLKKNINDNRILSLSFIFVLRYNHHTSSTRRLDVSIHQLLLDTMNIKKNWTSLPLIARTWCSQIDLAIASLPCLRRSKELRKLIRQFSDEADTLDDDCHEKNKDLIIVTKVLNDFTNKFTSWVNDCFLESSFIHQHIQPFFDHILGNDVNFIGCLGESHVKEKSTIMADYILKYVPPYGECFDLFVAEIKPVNKNCHSQLQSDFVKLGKQMKSMLDHLIKTGVNDPIVTGLLVDGYSCSTFMLSLKSDGIYILTELATFYLLRSPLDSPLIPTIAECFFQLKSLITTTANNINYLHQFPSSKTTSPSSSAASTTAPSITSSSSSSKTFSLSRTRQSCGVPIRCEKK